MVEHASTAASRPRIALKSRCVEDATVQRPWSISVGSDGRARLTPTVAARAARRRRGTTAGTGSSRWPPRLRDPRECTRLPTGQTFFVLPRRRRHKKIRAPRGRPVRGRGFFRGLRLFVALARVASRTIGWSSVAVVRTLPAVGAARSPTTRGGHDHLLGRRLKPSTALRPHEPKAKGAEDGRSWRRAA